MPNSSLPMASANSLLPPVTYRSPAALAHLDNVYLWQGPFRSGHRKSANKRSRDKDSKVQGFADDGLRAPKGKNSIANLRSSASSAQVIPTGVWRRVALRLTEHAHEPNTSPALLKVVAENDDVLATVFVHRLFSTEVRSAHRSLFNVSDVLAIYNSTPQPTLTGSVQSEPIYLRFPSTYLLHTWFAILRTYTIPETYGYHFATTRQGGLYRMWRSVQLTLQSARNLGIGSYGPNKATRDIPKDLSYYGKTGYGGGANPIRWDDDDDDFDGPTFFDKSEESLDTDLFCEFVVAGQVSARSTLQRGVFKPSTSLGLMSDPNSNPTWNESFVFDDLPVFADTTLDGGSDNSVLQVLVYRVPRKSSNTLNLERFGVGSKKVSQSFGALPLTPTTPTPSPSLSGGSITDPGPPMPFDPLPNVVSTQPLSAFLVGTAEISLANFRRGENVTGMFPVISPLDPKTNTGYAHLGDLKLKVKVDEELIMPMDQYQPVIDEFTQRNALSLTGQLHQKMHVDTVATHILRLASSRGTLIQDICQVAEAEIDATWTTNTLFRGNTVLTRTLELAMSFWGHAFLDQCVGGIIRRICEKNVSLDVSGRGDNTVREKDLAKDVNELIMWSQEVWDSIYNARADCPPEMRLVFTHIRARVESRTKGKGEVVERLRWQSITAFCFLRFFVPALLNPSLFGITAGVPPPHVLASLKEVAKVIQSLANMNVRPSIQVDEHMRPVPEFVAQNQSGMMDYILQISSPQPNPWPSSSSNNITGKHGNSGLDTILSDRLSKISILHRESIPTLPHLLDDSRTLASITSAVVRNARWPRNAPPSFINQRPASVNTIARLEAFVLACFKVETLALNAVTKLDPRASEAATKASGRGSGADLSASAGVNNVGGRHHLRAKSTIASGGLEDTTNLADAVLHSPPGLSPTMVFSKGPFSPTSSSSGSVSSDGSARSGRSGRMMRPSTAPSTSTNTGSGSFGEPMVLKGILRNADRSRFGVGQTSPPPPMSPSAPSSWNGPSPGVPILSTPSRPATARPSSSSSSAVPLPLPIPIPKRSTSGSTVAGTPPIPSPQISPSRQTPTISSGRPSTSTAGRGTSPGPTPSPRSFVSCMSGVSVGNRADRDRSTPSPPTTRRPMTGSGIGASSKASYSSHSVATVKQAPSASSSQGGEKDKDKDKDKEGPAEKEKKRGGLLKNFAFGRRNA